MILTIYDRYSNDIYHCNSKTLFIMGQNIGVIRKSNMECVDIFDKNRIRKTWYCLEYVLKHPEIFKPLLICNIGMVNNKESNKDSSLLPHTNTIYDMVEEPKSAKMLINELENIIENAKM